MNRTDSAGSITAAHALFGVATTLEAVSAWQQLGVPPVSPVLQQSCKPDIPSDATTGTDIGQ